MNGQTLHIRRAAVQLSSFDLEAGTFSAVAATETAVPRDSFFDGRFEEVLSLQPGAVRLARLQSGRAPILNGHRSGSAQDQIGVVTGARIEKGQLIIDGRMSEREDVKPIAADMAAGILQNVSVGYVVNASTETKRKDGTRVITRTDWEPFEISIVPIPADRNAHIRNTKGIPMPEEDGDVIDHVEEGHQAPQNGRATRPAMSGAQAIEARRLATRAGLSSEWADRLILEGVSLPAFRERAFDELAARSSANNTIAVHGAGESGSPAALETAISEALYARMSGRAAEGQAAEWRGRTLLDMGAALLHARGERPNWFSRERLATQILTRASHTTSDFPLLLTGAGNRVLQDAYKASETPLKNLARRMDAADFRPLSVLKLSEAPRLLKVAESSEIKQGSRGEAKESFKVETFARMFTLSRQAIINDDLGAFSDMSRAWGRAAAETEADELVALLLANSGNGASMDDGNPLYTTSRGNKAGSGGAISITTLGAARKALREMKGLDGVTPISVTPKHLVVGAAKETEAEQVLAEIHAAQAADANPFSGKLTLHVEPRLTGNSWRLFADPAEQAVIGIAYLNGVGGPMIDTREGWSTLGAEFRCVLDFGAGLLEWRGTYLNAGN